MKATDLPVGTCVQMVKGQYLGCIGKIKDSVLYKYSFPTMSNIPIYKYATMFTVVINFGFEINAHASDMISVPNSVRFIKDE